MSEFRERFLYKLRFLAVSTLIVAALSLLPFLLSVIWINPTVQAANTAPAVDVSNTNLDDSPNVITRGMFRGADRFRQSTGSAERAVNSSFHSVTNYVAAAATQSGKFVAHGVDSGVTFIAQGASSGFTFMVRATGNVFGFIANARGVSSIIKPADKAPVPVIDAHAHLLTAAQAALPAEKTADQATPQLRIDSGASWPIHGVITLEFGVPHWPYQPIHTGIDISDGQPSGVTPIHAFKSGRVIETVRSNVGFGNHVIIDHGGGITSLYGHLASISVRVGQTVNNGTILGYEGSTGASTGTHLHFEARLNGQPVDPRKYVSGQP